MKMFRSVLIISLLPLFSIAHSFNNTNTHSPENQPQFRVLGYFFSHGNWLADAGNIDLTNLTDLNIAFLNPDTSGSFAAYSNIKDLVDKAHAQKLRVFASIGGGEPPAHLKAMLAGPLRAKLVDSIAAFIQRCNFDGVDVDLENSFINENYAPFVSELSMAVKTNGKLLTSALAAWNSNLIADSTLQLYDFINIMSYDKTGPWNKANPGQHSPFSMAQSDFAYYTNRHIPAAKLLIGLPFYGYGFGGNAPESMNYKEIVANYPEAENKDMVEVSRGKVYYNGRATILQKVAFAKKNKAAGVMIWELQQDSNGTKSLLKAISALIAQ